MICPILIFIQIIKISWNIILIQNLKTFFGATNSNKNRKRNSKNNTLYNYLKKENLFHDYKTINITSYKKYNNISNDLIYL